MMVRFRVHAMVVSTLSTAAPPHESLLVQVDGMTCASCVNRVERALARVPGVLSASVNLATERAEVVRRHGRANTPALVAALDRAGYAGREVPATPEHQPAPPAPPG